MGPQFSVHSLNGPSRTGPVIIYHYLITDSPNLECPQQQGDPVIPPTAALWVKNRANETSGITIKLKIVSEATTFITQILAYDTSSFVKTMD
jgi:hypothetical protein